MPGDSRNETEVLVQGIPASQGIAYGPVFIYIQSDVEFSEYQIEPGKRDAEITRFDQALILTRQQIQKIQTKVEHNLGADEARIFDAHQMVLEDQALISETVRDFEKTGSNIETCFNRVSQRYIKAFDEIDDEYLRERAGDIRDVTQRVLANLLGHTAQVLSQLVEKRVVVANNISPSDAAGIDRSQALAIVTDSGSKTSHAVIVARSMKVPAVVGMRSITSQVRAGDKVLVDGYDGTVILNPNEETLSRYEQIKRQRENEEQRLLEANRLPAVTLDGFAVPIRANIESADESALVQDYRAAGVGLLRTEFLYFNSIHVPTEDELYEAYREVATALSPDPVVIRTLDIGGDKPMTASPHLFPHEDNPFLGYRAIRFCLDQVEIFKNQLRAILRASAHGNVLLMYPMISGRDELIQANTVLDECREELRAKNIPFDPNLKIGTMIEIPSAAYTADLLAKECDFFSIGTNDLIQYLLAIDRVNDRIAHLYEPTHPAVIRTLKHIVNEAHKAGIKVSVCGEMASDPILIPLLLGLGVDELSMTPTLIPAAKFLLRSITLREAQALAATCQTMDSPKTILSLCTEFCAKHMTML